ncbi:MAG: hypothetical protein QXD80_07530 [Acidilobaceae archaeon]
MVEKIIEELNKLNINFVGISETESVKFYVENEEQANKIIENIEAGLLPLKKEEVKIVIVGKLEPLQIYHTFELSGISSTKVLNPLYVSKELAGGKSVGSYDYKLTGTAGIINNEYKLISCYHVLLDSKNVISPGPLDGGDINDKVGYVEEFYNPKEDGYDISIADISESKNKYQIRLMETWKKVKGYGYAEINDKISKYGRSSGLTFSKVIDKNVYVKMTYPNIGDVILKNCYVCESFAIAGDSGSLAINQNDEAIGLITAGNSLITVVSSGEILKKYL